MSQSRFGGYGCLVPQPGLAWRFVLQPAALRRYSTAAWKDAGPSGISDHVVEGNPRGRIADRLPERKPNRHRLVSQRPIPFISASHRGGACATLPTRTPAARRSLGRRTPGRYYSRIRIYLVDGIPWSRRRAARRQGGPLHPHATTCGGRLEQLSGRPGRAKRFREGVLRPQAGGPRSEHVVHAAGARRNPVAGRRRPLQQLHEVLFGAARPVSIRELPGGAAGNDAAAEVGVFQHLRDVELDANDRRSAQHFLRA